MHVVSNLLSGNSYYEKSLVKPDAVVIATGAKPIILPIPGIENHKNVFDAQEVLAGKAEAGSKVVIIGGGLVGAETAAHLANHGKEVTLVGDSLAVLSE